jgi:hypothetical protein
MKDGVLIVSLKEAPLRFVQYRREAQDVARSHSKIWLHPASHVRPRFCGDVYRFKFQNLRYRILVVNGSRRKEVVLRPICR